MDNKKHLIANKKKDLLQQIDFLKEQHNISLSDFEKKELRDQIRRVECELLIFS